MQEAVCKNDKEALRRNIQEVRAQIADVLMEIDKLTLQVKRQIEVDYAVKVGCYENELLQAQIAARRAKRRLELAQARCNRVEALDEDALEQGLDQEFEEWEAQLAQQVDDYLAKLEWRTRARELMPHEVRELRELHRELVKRLHPDLHPQQSEDEERLFQIMQGAYKNGDLETLRSLQAATAYLAQPDEDGGETADALYAEYELLCAQLRVTQERLEAIKGMPPFTLLDQLNDPEWVCERVEELKAAIAQQKEAKRAYDQRYQQLLARVGAPDAEPSTAEHPTTEPGRASAGKTDPGRTDAHGR